MAPAAKRPSRVEGVAAPIVRTGNYLVQFEKGLKVKDEIKLLHKGNGRVVTASDFQQSEMNMEPLVQYAEAELLDHIGVAVLRGDNGDHHRQLSILEKKRGVRHILPEFYIFARTSDEVAFESSEDDSGIHEDTLSCRGRPKLHH